MESKMPKQLSALNPNPRKLPGPDNLQNLVAREGNDGRPAIEYLSPEGTNEQVTYEQLHQRADFLARLLRSKLTFDTTTTEHQRLIVPIFVQQCPLLYISELAILKAGAAFCPLPLDIPEERLRFILEDIQATVLLTTTQLQEKLPILDSISVVTVDDIAFDNEVEQLHDHVDPSQTAYIMYTSGSTGKPKGVILSHTAATQALLAHERHIPEFSRFLQFASPTFDVSVFEIFFTLFRGRTLVCGDRRQLLNDLPGFINTMRVDAAELTPSVASSLLRGRYQLPSLKLLLTIGEMLKRDVIEEYGGPSSEQSILYGMYGPTEATIHCTLLPAFTNDMQTGNIGIPLDTVSAFVVKPQAENDPRSENIEILPIDEEGELAVGGYQLADGYLNRPEQTKAAFVSHSKFGKLYRTGDRAKLTQTGLLECLGRISTGQVKLRGQRIELGEIEYAAAQTPGCETAVAEIVAGSLVVFCLFSSRTTDPAIVREACRNWLPSFMVPADVVILDELPYLDSGKVDRKALQQMHSAINAQVKVDVHNQDERLRSIVEIVSGVLGVSLDSETPLLAAGMDSLSSIRISAQLKRAGFSQLDATVVLESRTARDIDVELQKIQAIPEEGSFSASPLDFAKMVYEDPLVMDQLDEIDYVYPATAVQSSMLLETERRSSAYCNWIELDISKQLTANEVINAIHQLAQAHSLLRSGFIPMDGQYAKHAIVAWKTFRSSQTRVVEDFAYDFSITKHEELLRPCSFQIRMREDGARILLQIHHAQYDQWSLDVLRADLHDILQSQTLSFRQSFGAVSKFHLECSEVVQSGDKLEFWYNVLQGFTPTTIPSMVGRKVPAAQQRSPWHTMNCDLGLIRSKAKELRCSVPAIFQSAMVYLLGSYVGTSNITFGTVFSGRHVPLEGIEGVFGPCLSTLPLRLDYSTARTCADLARLVQSRNRALQRHSMTPLATIKGLLRNMGDQHIFDTLFVWQETTLEPQEIELMVREIDSADQHEYNLVMEFEPCNDAVRMRVTFQQALISPQQIDHIMTQVQYYVNRIVNDPNSLVEKLNECLPASTLSVVNPHPESCAEGHNLVKAIEAHADASPSAPALIFADSIPDHKANTQTLTYRELNEHSNGLARFLLSHHRTLDHLVCIYMEKSVQLYIGILATIKAGFGYLPIIPDTPLPRVRSIMQQANVSFCICDSNTKENLSDVEHINVLDLSKLAVSAFHGKNLDIDFPPDRVAYTIFTSGSTGEPKGVPVTMRNLLGNIQALSELYPATREDRLLQACSHAFDVSVFEIFFTFYNGMCLCSATKEVLFQDFTSSIRTFEITHLSLTPTVAALVDPAAVTSVQFLVTAGEAMAEAVHSRWSGRRLNQGYGPSETTNICSVNMNMSSDDVLGNIGPPLRNTSAFVLSPKSDFEILPYGAFGELAFGGEQVFPGYLGREDLNERKVIQHPEYGRIYKSGDLGRLLYDGSMLISGRLDDQVKVRGNRVELNEINAILLQSDNVRNCATLTAGHETSSQSIASFIVPMQATTLDAIRETSIKRLFDFLEEALPAYMIPNTITAVDEIPRTSQGKLDQTALRQALAGEASTTTRTFAREDQDASSGEEWSAEEAKVAYELASLLSIESKGISRRASLYSFGLNSLNAISFAKRLSDASNTQVSVSTVLRNPSIARLAQKIEHERSSPITNGNVKETDLLPRQVSDYVRELSLLSGQDIQCVLPCTPLQEAMLSASTATTDQAYWNTLTLNVHGDIDAQRLRRSFDHMVETHSVLRTRFVGTNDRTHPFVQVVLTNAKLQWKDNGLKSTASPGHETALSSSATADIAYVQPFQIDHCENGQKRSFTLHMHHAIYDGISISQLLEDVELDYKGETLQPPASFEVFLLEAKKHSGQEAIEFWSTELDNFKPNPFPSSSRKGDSEHHLIQKNLSITIAELDRWCKRHSISQSAVFQTALVKTLAISQQMKDICFGNVVSGRSIPIESVDRLVAPCFNTVPARIALQENDSNVEVAMQLNRKNIKTLPFQLAPLRRLQSLSLRPSKHLFDCLLIVQPPQRPLDSDIWTVEEETGIIDMPLVFELIPNNGSFDLAVHYSERYLSDHDAVRLRNAFSFALSSCLRYPSGGIEDFDGFDHSSISGLLASQEDPFEQANGKTAAVAVNISPVEESVREVFARLSGLSTNSIGRDTSMFQIGLDSLNAPQVAAQLRSAGIGVDAGDVLECRTPSAIATRSQSGSSKHHRIGIDVRAFDKKTRRKILKQSRTLRDAIEAVWPCTAVQSGMLSQSLQSNGDLYINHITYRVPKAFSQQDLWAAWEKVTAKYQILRMGFHKTDDLSFPFAMSILKQAFASAPVYEMRANSTVKLVETTAKELIVRSIDRQAWCVHLFTQNDEISMTLSLHHALYDADSLRQILDDLYNTIALSDLGPPASIEASLTANLNAALDHSETGLKFWSHELQDSTATKFPDLTPTVAADKVLEYEDHNLNVSLRTLDDFCRSQNATIQALGQAVWAMLLSAYIGDRNITFGTVFSGHAIEESEAVAFPGITTIPVPCDTSNSSLEILSRMVRFNALAHRHRFVPLADIQRVAKHESGPLFDTVFVYQKSPPIKAFDWTIVAETAAVDYAASLELQSQLDGHVTMRITFQTDRIPPSQARLMLLQYEQILREIVTGQQSHPQSIYSVLPAKEPQILSQAPLLHRMVERTALQHPDRTALTFVKDLAGTTSSQESWTYDQLNSRANQVANLLQQAGIAQRNIVAVCMNKCAEASFAFLGILKAGCSFLAIDPDLPRARLEFILRDSDAKLLLINEGTLPKYAQDESVCLELNTTLLDALPSSPIEVDVASDATCYCLYTSGTTGTPKGCEITHDNAVQAMMSFERLFAGHWTERSRWLQFASYWFDVSVLEQFWSWSVGIEVVGAPRDVVLEDIPGFISAQNITHIDLTPSLARLLKPQDVPSLWNGVFITGGEALKQEIIDAWGPKNTICNGYGPTEATIGVTMNTFIGADAKPSNIGRQFDNVGTYVLRPQSDDPVLRGAVGELCVSGRLVGKGYLNRSELTAKQFPVLERSNERVYRTGDLVRVLADGSFSFVGRQDSQAKLRGQRLEISEIDNVILHCADDIAHVISLITRGGPANKDTLVSFLTRNAGKHAEELEIDLSESSLQLLKAARKACSDRLPGYMVPTHVLPINFLPLTVNNKIDSKRLIELFANCSSKDLQSLSGSEQEPACMTASEQQILASLRELLSVEPQDVTPHSNLFSVGLSSISAISFSNLLKKKGFKRASVAAVMSNPSARQLSIAIDGSASNTQGADDSVDQAKLSIAAFAQRNHGMAARFLSVGVDEIEAVVPCTPLQQGLILDSLRLGNHPYFNDFCYVLESVDVGRLRAAIQNLVGQVQALRTRFVDTNLGTAQVVLRQVSLPISTWYVAKNVKCATYVRRLKARWIEANQDELVQPFEAHILWAEDRWFLRLHIHHALYDGISFDLFISHLVKLYEGESSAEAAPNFINALPYGPLRQVKTAKSFWQRRLEGFSHKSLPPSQSLPREQEDISVSSLIDANSLEPIRKAVGVSHQALVQSCFEIALRKCVPSIHLYGIVVSGRSIELAGADQILGPMFNTLPQPLRKSFHSTLKQYIRARHDDNVAVLPYQHTPLRNIRKWTGQLSTDSMFDVLFVFQHANGSTKSIIEGLMHEIEQKPQAHYPLSCEVELADDGKMRLHTLAQSKFFDQGSVEHIVNTIDEILQCVAQNTDANIGQTFGIEIEPTVQSQQNGSSIEEQANDLQHFEWTPTALTIRAAIASLLNLNGTEIDENNTIFTLGLDSIDAVKLASRLRKDGLSIPVSKILQAQTIPRILQAVEMCGRKTTAINIASKLSQLRDQLRRTLPSLQLTSDEDVETILPATPAQEALLADMHRTELREYFNHDVLRLESSIHLHQLKHAWQTVVDHSPILRTMFVEVSHPDIEVVFAQVVLKSAPLAFDEREAQHESELETIFDTIRLDVLSKIHERPTLRLTVVKIKGERYLILSLAHAQYDGHSLALLHEDVRRAYQNCFKPRPSYHIAIEAALTAVNEKALHFWTDTLSGAVACPFPHIGSNTEASQTYRAERATNISSSSARAFCKTYGISMQALVQTSWALTLAHYMRSLEVMFGVVLACRDSKEAEEVMFPTMNTVIMRASLHGSKAQMVQHMHALGVDMLPHQRTPLRAIQAAVAKNKQDSGAQSATHLFDTIFIYQHRPESQDSVGAPLYESVGGSSDVEYPVAVEMEASDPCIIIRGACRGFVLDQIGTEQLLETVEDVLAALINAPDEPTVEFDGNEVSICGMDSFYLDHLNNEEDAVSEQTVEEDTTSVDTSSTTSAMIEALAEVSKVPLKEISPSTTIESIGIDSISAIKVVALLRKQDILLSVSEILRARTASRMAKSLVTTSAPTSGNEQSASESITRAIQPYLEQGVLRKAWMDPSEVSTILPATAGQIYMLSMWQKTAGQLFYSTFRYQLDAEVNKEDIYLAWKNLISHHPILRTVFCTTGDINSPVLQVVLRQTPESKGTEPGVASDAYQPMISLQTKKNDSGHELKLRIHHALYDAVSLPILMQDLGSLIASKPLPPPTLKFDDFIAPSATHRAKQLRKHFWSDYFDNINPLSLHQPQAGRQQRRIEIFHPALFQGVEDLEKIARKEDISLQSVLFAAYAKVYASLTTSSTSTSDRDSQDVVLGIYLSNRSHMISLESLPAPTVNLVPLLVRSPQRNSLLEVARKVQEDLQKIGTVEHSAVGLWEVQQWTGVRVDTFVNFLKLPEHGEDGGNATGPARIKPLDDERRAEQSRVVEIGQGDGFEMPTELEGMKGLDAYLHSLDIEMTVTDGKLDVGLFCPESMVSLKQAEDALAEFKALLEKFTGKARA